jgi:hypothetical protein
VAIAAVAVETVTPLFLSLSQQADLFQSLGLGATQCTESVHCRLNRLNDQAPDVLVSYQVAEEMRASMTLILVHADSRQRLWQGDASDEAYQASNGALLCHRLVNGPRLR